jgi:hypothetical protein
MYFDLRCYIYNVFCIAKLGLFRNIERGPATQTAEISPKQLQQAGEHRETRTYQQHLQGTCQQQEQRTSQPGIREERRQTDAGAIPPLLQHERLCPQSLLEAQGKRAEPL